MNTITMIFSIGAFIISLICYYEITKKKRPRKQSNDLNIIHTEFKKEAQSERQHRMKQREKYGILDKDGKFKNRK